MRWHDEHVSDEAKYLRVEWVHDDPEYPVVLYSALDVDGWEVRKVDVWADGRGQTSDSFDDEDTQSTSLGTVPTPPLTEINRDPQFRGVEITAAEFEVAWRKYVTD